MAGNVRMDVQGGYVPVPNDQNNQGARQRPLYARIFCCCSESSKQDSNGSGGQSSTIEKVKKKYTSSVVDPAQNQFRSKQRETTVSDSDTGSYQPPPIRRTNRKKSNYDEYTEKLMSNPNTPSASASDLAEALNQ